MAKKRTPHSTKITATISLVEHGYQIDIFKRGRLIGSECKDFGGDYPLKKLQTFVVAALVVAMKRLEANFLIVEKHSSTPVAQNAPDAATVLDEIYEHLFRSYDDDKKHVWDPDKEWSVDLIEQICESVEKYRPRPKGVITIPVK